MNVRLRPEPLREAPPESEGGRGGDAAAAWLNAMCAVLRFPAAEARAVREELASHLRDRIDDLMLGGCGEDEATRRAIAELGEAAAVAARFRAVRSSARRRFLMNVSMLALAGGAAVMSVVAFLRTGEPEVPMAVYAPAAQERVAGTIVKIQHQTADFEDVLNELAAAAGMPVQVDWLALEEAGIEWRSEVTAVLPGVPFERAFEMLAEQLSADPSSRPAFRVHEGVIWVSTRAKFDRAETVLVSYDLGRTLQAMRDREPAGAQAPDMDDITGALMELVEPEGWRGNGGDLASLTAVGQTIFVKAPPRYHDQIRWVLAQLPSQHERGAEVHVVPRVESSGPDGTTIRLESKIMPSGSGN